MKTNKYISLCKPFILLVCCLWLFSSCRTTTTVVEKAVETSHHDTIRVERQLRDSVYLHDSVYIDRSRDTILIERWHTAYRDRIQMRDSIVVQRDTVPVEIHTTETINTSSDFMKTMALVGMFTCLCIALYIIRLFRK